MSLTGVYRKLSFRLFVWQGVEVFVDVTALLILVSWVTKDDRIGFIRDKDKFLLGLIIGLGVIISILVHELAHAWVGILSGAKVSKIYLNVLGGVCIFKLTKSFSPPKPHIKHGSKLNSATIDELAHEVKLQKTCYYPQIWPKIIPEVEQAQLKAPTLLLVGADNGQFDPELLVKHVTRVMPGIQAAEIVPDATTNLTGDQPDLVNAWLLRFLQEGI